MTVSRKRIVANVESFVRWITYLVAEQNPIGTHEKGTTLVAILVAPFAGDTSTGVSGFAFGVLNCRTDEYVLVPAVFFALTLQKYVPHPLRGTVFDVSVKVESSTTKCKKFEFVST